MVLWAGRPLPGPSPAQVCTRRRLLPALTILFCCLACAATARAQASPAGASDPPRTPAQTPYQVGERLTYAELFTAARRVAVRLREHGAGPGTRVAVLGEKTAAAVVSVLGTLLAGAAYVPLDPSAPDCKPELPRDTPAAFRKIFPQFFTAYYFADKVSLISCLYTHRYDSVDHLRLGAMPLVVLSTEHTWDGTASAWFTQSYAKVWIGMHEALAHLSSRGVHRIIEGTGHEIQLDKPQAVIDAVDEVLLQLHAGTKS